MYCFEDASDPDLHGPASSSRVGLHVHTPFRWGDRNKKNPQARAHTDTPRALLSHPY
jgi:hypothetical protein